MSDILRRLYDRGVRWIYPAARRDDFSSSDVERFVEVEDRGSDVTVFAFAGLAAHFAGMPIFEFRRVLQRCGNRYNLVFFRDIRRLSYHLTPEGGDGGLAFYQQHVDSVRKSLGAGYNIAVGTSIGGSAAMYFGARCGMNQVVAFSPVCSFDFYCGFWNQLQTYSNLARFVRSPHAYRELTIVTLGTWICYVRLHRMLGREKLWRVVDEYRRAGVRPRVTLFYGSGCRPDARQAKMFDGLAEVRCVALPTIAHNCARYLKQRGELAARITEEIQAARRSGGA